MSFGSGVTVMEKREILAGWVTKVCLKCTENWGRGPGCHLIIYLKVAETSNSNLPCVKSPTCRIPYSKSLRIRTYNFLFQPGLVLY